MNYKNSWQNSLHETLNRLQQITGKGEQQLRVAILGIGNEILGDDAAGVLTARSLKLGVAAQKKDGVLVLEGAHAPESFTGVIRRFDPDLVLLIDIAFMGHEPGSICWLPWQETAGLSASSHTMPPYMLAQYLTNSLGCEVALIGIEPLQTELGAPVSAVVGQAVEEVVGGIDEILGKRP